LIHIIVIDQPIFVRVRKVELIIRATVKIHPRFERSSNSLSPRGLILMREINIFNGIAVADDPLLIIRPAPMLTQYIINKIFIRAARNAIHSVIGAHECPNVCLHTCLEGGHVALCQILHRDLRIELEAPVSVPALHVAPGEVLAGGDYSLVLRIIASLEAINESSNIGRQVENVFSWSFLASTPARVFEAIDVRNPEVKTAPVGIVERPALCADNGCNGIDEFVVKSRTHENGL
jgi:hypothetical protein